MEPLYSVLLYNQNLSEYEPDIDKWLKSGIKIFWFGKEADVASLKIKYKEFAKAFLLQGFVLSFDAESEEVDYFTASTMGYNGINDFSTVDEPQIIIDGNDTNELIDKLENIYKEFNAAQYRVEHCDKDDNITVQASAGTGKTTVMVDRIMFLMHTVPDLHMSDIHMITFTNEATDQMNLRLQNVLMKRFQLTGQKKYFRWLEEQSQMNISTIHSFAYGMLKEYGISQSFTKGLSINSLKFERKELIKDTVDRKTDSNSSVKEQVGLPFYKANNLIDKFWSGFSNMGISHEDIGEMDWGKAYDKGSEAFHKLLSGMVEELDDEYFDLKRQRDAVGLNDIMRDLQEVLLSGNTPAPDISMKYLFIDEFQDSDLSQIMVANLLSKKMNSKLFVVGDVKQSIYRFRGATDLAFDILKKDMRSVGLEESKVFYLRNNYRTCANVLDSMNLLFEAWSREGKIQYDASVIPFNTTEGTVEMISGDKEKDIENQIIVDTANEKLADLIDRVVKSQKTTDEKDRVVMLVRTNDELDALARLLRNRKVPAEIRRDGYFYRSDAVRDFYALICSYMFADEPKYIFNYLFTPYTSNVEGIDVNLMEQLNGDYDKLIEYLLHFLNQDIDESIGLNTWERYYKEFRLKPVMAVIKNIFDREPILDTYIANSLRRKLDMGWEEERCIASTRTEAMQYQANLEKLMEVIQARFTGDTVSLYDIYAFLKNQIATNRSDSEPQIESNDNYRSILCMTVHKSKGLEFDTVMIPYTARQFPFRAHTEIIIDPISKEVGWNFNKEKNNQPMKNDLYNKLHEQEVIRTEQEETRLLYVAMTRTINHLVCIIGPTNKENTWSYLLSEVDIDE